MFISPCLLFLTLFRMFLQAGEGEASQRGEHGARTLASLPPRVCVSSASSASSWTEKLRPEMERDLPKVTSKCDAEDFLQRELRGVQLSETEQPSEQGSVFIKQTLFPRPGGLSRS